MRCLFYKEFTIHTTKREVLAEKDDVLIVEDSPAIGMLLKNYLKKLEYTHIHICGNGTDAIATFTDLVSQGKQPVVLLDYMLPDMDARSILTQMLEVKPDVRVILETANTWKTYHQSPMIMPIIAFIVAVNPMIGVITIPKKR